MKVLFFRNFAINVAAPLTLCFLCSPALAQENPTPVRLERDLIAGIGLTGIPTDSFKDIIVSGIADPRAARLFDGTELTVSVFESTPGKTDHKSRPFTIDEFVYVLSGKLILTEPDGTAHEFTTGDAVVVPVGFAGTWEMQGNFRELVVARKKPEKEE